MEVAVPDHPEAESHRTHNVTYEVSQALVITEHSEKLRLGSLRNSSL